MADTSAQLFDVCIVGAGPGGLSALSAILEPYSVEHLADDQVRRAARAAPPQRKSVCVVDPQPWLSAWRTRFSALEINWLRSPAMAHPDMFDAFSLAAFAHARGRSCELREICPESRLAIKSGGDALAGNYFLPSSQLFLDFCDSLTEKLPHTFLRDKVVSVDGDDGAFEVGLSDGSTVHARSVVLALGVAGPPALPAAFADLPPHIAFHTEDCARLHELQSGRTVLVIGGGLTAVQAALMAVKRDCRVVLCSRRKLVTRDFDIPVDWFNPRIQARLRHGFWEQPAEARLRHLKAAKGGGSVPHWYMMQLQDAEMSGMLKIVCGEARVDAVQSGGATVTVDGVAQHFDHVILACGHAPNSTKLPLVCNLQEKWPVEVVGGLPVLSPDLQWGDKQQLFVVGALAALQVGPDAANLMGCRRAAHVVAQGLGLRSWLGTVRPKGRSISVCGNRYAALSDSESEEEDRATDVGSVVSGLQSSNSSEQRDVCTCDSPLESCTMKDQQPLFCDTNDPLTDSDSIRNDRTD